MDNTKKPAFPTYPGNHNGLSGEEYGIINGEPGLTKREYVAALCLQGMLANNDLFKIVASRIRDTSQQCAFYNQAAIEQADDLFKQLEENKIS